jgi:hypothetical protein
MRHYLYCGANPLGTPLSFLTTPSVNVTHYALLCRGVRKTGVPAGFGPTWRGVMNKVVE